MFAQDIRSAFRQIRRNPGFALVVTLSLACGIGANTAIFSAMNGLVLKSLPVKDPQELIQLDSVNRNSGNTLRGFSYPGFEMLRKASSPVLSGAFAYTSPDTSSSISSPLATANVIYQGDAAVARGMLASADMYSVLGLRPAVGRLFVAAEERMEGGSPVAVLSYAYWQTRFGGDSAVIGKSIIVNRVPLTVVGVTPPEFRGVELGYAPDFTAPLSMAAALKLQSMENRGEWWLAILGRKKQGVSDLQVETALQPVFHSTVEDLIQATPAALAPDIQKMAGGLTLKVNRSNQGASATARFDLRRSFAYLLAIFILLLGIACINIANLILARTATRGPEIRLRLSLGASRAQVFRQLLTEIVVLSFMAGVLALPLAWLGGPFLVNVFADSSLSQSLSPDPDWRVFSFSLCAVAACSLFLGLVPVFQVLRAKLQSAVQDGRSYRSKVPDALMVAQIALALLLTVGAGLFVRSFQNIRRINPGFRPDSVLVFRLTPSSAGYSAGGFQQLYTDLTGRLRRLPGVMAVSFAKSAPGETNMGTLIRIVGEAPRSQDEPVSVNAVAPNYFETVGIDLLFGRHFNIRDMAYTSSVAIVNQVFAHRYFGNNNPLGKSFTLLGNDKAAIEIVGVVRDVKEHGLLDHTPAMAYLPESSGDMTFFLRTSGNPLRLISVVRGELKALDPLVPLSGISTLNLQLDESVSREHLLAILSSIMGLLALALAGIGLYGVIAYSVSRETKAIGIRMALGAEAPTILWNVFRRVLLLVSAGTGIGLVCVLGLSKYVTSLLYGLSPSDPINITASATILLTVALAAAFLPARRASQVDPMIALREE